MNDVTGWNPDVFIESWFREDIGDGDHTTLSTIPEDATGSARLLAKEAGIIAGVRLAERIFTWFDNRLTCNILTGDGNRIQPGDVVLTVSGPARSILQTERLVLNVLQRMSGIATRTRRAPPPLSSGSSTRAFRCRSWWDTYPTRAACGSRTRCGFSTFLSEPPG